jgi:hypothetical protein
VALGHLAEIHFPKAMTCAFGTAAHSLHGKHIRTQISKSFRSMMMEEWHGAEYRGNDA